MANEHQTKSGLRFMTSYNPETICALPVIKTENGWHLRIDLPNMRGLTREDGHGTLNFKPIHWQILVKDSLGRERWESLSSGIETKKEFNEYLHKIGEDV